MKMAQEYKKRWRFKIFLFFCSGGHLVYQSEMILANFVEIHLGNISVKF